MPTQDMPGSGEPHSPDNSQGSEPVSEGSLPASSSSANSHQPTSAAQNQNTGNTGLSSTPHVAITAGLSTAFNCPTSQNATNASSGEDSLNSTVSATALDEPESLRNSTVDRVPSPQSPVPTNHSSASLNTSANGPPQASDEPPPYSDINTNTDSSFVKELSKPPRHNASCEKSTDQDSSDQECLELSQNKNSNTFEATCPSDPSSGSSPVHKGNLSEGDQPVLHIGLNLIRACKRLLDFLATVNDHPELYSGQIVDNAIYRYEHLWLPLLSDYICSTNGVGAVITPPLDVHWVWVVHMLAPQHYIPDCTEIVGQMLPHRLLSQNALPVARNCCKQIWKKMYPNHPWKQDNKNIMKIVPRKPSKIKYDIKEAVGRQSAFFYQVSLSHYRCGSFLRAAIRRYRQFLHLKLNERNTFLVPCYDIDLVWHAHQVHPTIYFNDTRTFLGRLLHHDDSVNDRNDGSKLVVSDNLTRKLWQSMWDEDFRRHGAMFRGDPPNTYINKPPRELTSLARICHYCIQIMKVKVKGMFPEGPLKIKLRHQLRSLGDLTVQHGGSPSEHNVEGAGIELNLSSYELGFWLVVKVAPEKRFGRLLSMLRRGRFWCMTNLLELHDVKSGDITKELVEDDCSIELHLRVTRSITPNWVPVLTLTGPFEPVSLPVIKLTAQMGMVVCSQHRAMRTLQSSAPELNCKVPLLQQNKTRCLPSNGPPVTADEAKTFDTFEVHMATHRLVNNSHPQKPQLFEVEVSHSRALMLSSIHVYAACDMMPWAHDDTMEKHEEEHDLHRSNDTSTSDSCSDLSAGTEQSRARPSSSKTGSILQPPTSRRLVALAHTLDPNTLPTPHMLKVADKNWMREGTALCDWDAGERAFIIKSSDGRDWAILVGRWTGLRRGVPGSCGELSLRIYCPVNEAPVHLELPYSKNMFEFVVKNCWVDLKNGLVQVAAGEKEFVENITLGLAVTVLHVLCQPPSETDTLTDGQPDNSSPSSKHVPDSLSVDQLSFLSAAGCYCAAAPTNCYRLQLSQEASGAALLERRQLAGTWARYNSLTCDYPLLVPVVMAQVQQSSYVGGTEGGYGDVTYGGVDEEGVGVSSWSDAGGGGVDCNPMASIFSSGDLTGVADVGGDCGGCGGCGGCGCC